MGLCAVLVYFLIAAQAALEYSEKTKTKLLVLEASWGECCVCCLLVKTVLRY